MRHGYYLPQLGMPKLTVCFSLETSSCHACTHPVLCSSQGIDRVFNDFLNEVRTNAEHPLQLTASGYCSYDMLTDQLSIFYSRELPRYEKEAKEKKQITGRNEAPDREPELTTTLLNHYGIYEGRHLNGMFEETVLSGFQKRVDYDLGDIDDD